MKIGRAAYDPAFQAPPDPIVPENKHTPFRCVLIIIGTSIKIGGFENASDYLQRKIIYLLLLIIRSNIQKL